MWKYTTVLAQKANFSKFSIFTKRLQFECPAVKSMTESTDRKIRTECLICKPCIFCQWQSITIEASIKANLVVVVVDKWPLVWNHVLKEVYFTKMPGRYRESAMWPKQKARPRDNGSTNDYWAIEYTKWLGTAEWLDDKKVDRERKSREHERQR